VPEVYELQNRTRPGGIITSSLWPATDAGATAAGGSNVERFGISLTDRVFLLIGRAQSWPLAWRLGIGTVAVLVAMIVRITLLGGLETRLAYVTLYPAVVFAAIVGGLPGGIFATILSAALAHVLITPLKGAADWLGLATFLTSGLFITGMAGVLHTARARAEKMHQSEQELRKFIAEAPVAIAMFDREMCYLVASGRWIADFCPGERNLAGRSHYELLPEIPDRWKIVHQRALAGEVLKDEADRFERADGRTQWLRWEVRPWHDATGAIGGILIFADDITARVESEQALRESRNDLNRAQAVARTGSWRMDVTRNELLWSAENHRIFGVAAGTPLTYESFLAIVHPDDRDEVHTKWQAALAGEVYHIVHRILVGGEVRWVRERAELEFAADGRLLGAFGTTQDITEKKQSEEALRESEERLRMSNEAGGIGTFVVDLAGDRVVYSPELSAMFGVPGLKEVQLPDAFARVHREDIASVRAQYDAALTPSHDDRLRMEFRYVRVGGEIRWMTWNGRVDFHDTPLGRRPARIIGACVDITERKKSEEALREGEERLRLALEAGGGGAWHWDSATDSVIVTDSYRNLYGFPVGQAVTYASWLALLHPEDREKVRSDVNQILRSGSDYYQEFRVRHPERGERWLRGQGRVERDDAGAAVRFFGIDMDITERKVAELEIQRFVSLAENSTQFIGMCDMNYVPFYANKAGLKMVGLESVSQLAETPVPEFFFPEDRGFIINEFFPRVLREGRAELEIRFRHFKTGEPMWMIYNVFYIRGERGQPIGLATVSVDITERKRAEAALSLAKDELEQRVEERTAALRREMQGREAAQAALAQAQRLEVVGRLAGGLAHDFNNALTAIAANLELAALRIQDGQARADIQNALDIIEMSASLNRRLLTFARRGEVVAEITSINDRALGVIRILEKTLRGGVVFATDLASDLWPTRLEPGELDSAILNLAINARDAMPEGGLLTMTTRNVTLDTDSLPTDFRGRPGDYVHLSIHDTGTGMTEEVKRRATEPFFTTKEKSSNTGLGLSSVEEIVTQSGGFLSIDSAVGTGTTVSLFLPRAADVSSARKKALLRSSDVPLGDGELILLVDDDQKVLEATHAILEGLGYAVISAENGPQAMAVMERGDEVDLVFSDIIMPGGMSGYDVARTVRTKRPDIKVVLASGFHNEELARGDRFLDGISVLRKPYSRGQLAQVLSAALSG
jgi:PAS domain S-box-containing protein